MRFRRHRTSPSEASAAAEHTSTVAGHTPIPPRRTRRDVLVRAGTATVATVGGLAVLDQQRAQAATSGSLILGQVNDANSTTELIPTSGTTPTPLLQVDGTALAGSGTSLLVNGPAGGVAISAHTPTSGTAISGSGDGTASGIFGHGVNGDGVVGSSGTGYALHGTGGAAQLRLAPGDAAGPPSSGAHLLGEVYMDLNGAAWLCVAAGSPGGWSPLLTGGNSIMETKITTQPQLSASNGTAWSPLGVAVTFQPTFNCIARCTANADLWTDVAGYNQDLGIFIQSGLFSNPPGTMISWKESGGFAGTFSPNAVYVDGIQAGLVAGTLYQVALYWKANRSMPSGKLWCGAGNGPEYSPTRLIVQLIPA